MVCLDRDNEEIGSVSSQGAESNFLEAILTRVSSAFAETPSPALTERTLAASFLLSCDMGSVKRVFFLPFMVSFCVFCFPPLFNQSQ